MQDLKNQVQTLWQREREELGAFENSLETLHGQLEQLGSLCKSHLQHLNDESDTNRQQSQRSPTEAPNSGLAQSSLGKDILTRIETLPGDLRERVTRLASKAGAIFEHFRQVEAAPREHCGDLDQEPNEDAQIAEYIGHRTRFISDVLFSNAEPPPLIVLEAIAQHCLHLNRTEVFKALCEETAAFNIEVTSEFKQTLEQYPWITESQIPSLRCLLTCFPPTTSSLDTVHGVTLNAENENNGVTSINEWNSASEKQLANTSITTQPSALQLVRPEVVEAQQELHQILHDLSQGNAESALRWLENLDSKKRPKNALLVFKCHVFQLLKIAGSTLCSHSADGSAAKNVSIALMQELLGYIRKRLLPYLPQLRREISGFLGALATYSNRFNEAVRSPEQILNVLALLMAAGKIEIGEARTLLPSLEAQCGDATYSDIKRFYEIVQARLAWEFRRVFCRIGTKVRSGLTGTNRQAYKSFSNCEQGASVANVSIKDSKTSRTQSIVFSNDQCSSAPHGNEHFDPDTSKEDTGTVYSVVRLSEESPLAVAVAAGMVCLPTLQNLRVALQRNCGSEQLKKWKLEQRFPLEVDLGPCFHFHTCFTCPICHSLKDTGEAAGSHTSARTKPCHFPCGHMICRSCLDEMISRARRSNVKCPTCPQQAQPNSVRELVFNWSEDDSSRDSLLRQLSSARH